MRRRRSCEGGIELGRRYEHPPLTEAIVEVHFAPGVDWSDALITGLHDRLRGSYPDREQVSAFEGQIALGPEGVSQHLRPIPRSQLWRSDRRAVVQLSPNLLTVNHLRPYPTWEEFRPEVERALAAYVEVASPPAVNSVNLQYINEIVIPEPRIEMADYFRLYPQLDGPLPQEHGTFLLTVELHFEGGADSLRVQLSTLPAEGAPANQRFLLVLRYSPASTTKLGDVLAVLDVAHAHVEDTFEGCITDRLRAIFQEVDAA